MQQRPVLLPVPRQLTWGSGVLTLPSSLVVVAGNRHQELLAVLTRFKATVQSHLGIAVEIAASAKGLTTTPHVVVDANSSTIAHEQGYGLTVGAGQVQVVASSAEGAANGLATLKQLLLTAGRHVPEVIISDWPDFRRRGVMLDISRGKVPTMESLFRFVDLLADLKVNEFQLYTEHTFAYREHREVWQAYSPMTGEEILLLDRYCRERFVDLVPNQNSFGHLTPWLVHDRYKQMAEAPEGFNWPWGGRSEEPFSLCPIEPSVTPFLSELYDELLPHFSSPYFNVGCDETWDVGQGRSKDAVAQLGEHRVYLDQLLRIYNLVKARGKVMQFWGDIIIQAPELIPELPKDIVALEWGYEAGHPFKEHGEAFGKAGIPFYVCPGTSTWNSIVGRTDNAIGNMLNAAENGLKHGAIGFLNTMWGDRGHQDYEPVSYLPIAFGAGVSWALEANRDADVRSFLDRLVFGDKAGKIGQALYELGNTYRAAGIEPFNATALCSLFHHWGTRPHAASVAASINLETQEAAIHKAAALLDEVELTGEQGALVLAELRSSVRLLLHLCGFLRVRHVQAEGGAPDREFVASLARDLDEIAATHRELWLKRNRLGGLEEMGMVPFRRLQAEYKRLLA